MNFNTSKEEFRQLHEIAKRAVNAGLGLNDLMEIEMDITACHCNGTPLKLNELLEADAFDFNHDICGINRCINRETGELENCFLPRFAV